MEQTGKKHNHRVQETCPACGMAKSEWTGNGVERNGTLYCCAGCANGTGCTCATRPSNAKATTR